MRTVSPMSDPEAVVEHLDWQDARVGERFERKRDRASSSTVCFATSFVALLMLG